MKRTKAPVLTSPSKIGFFVSLMLVFVSIGVTSFFTRRFGLTWNLFDRDWLDRNEWLGIIRGEGFLFELLPLVGLVAVMSMIAYLVITGAVRKYKHYLDSGCDYRNLISSLKDLEDLEDKRKIERIKNHPELKRLLLGLAETFEERERLLSEREGALETRLQDAVRRRETELVEGFAQECDRLVTAIESGSVEPSAIDFSNPGLRKLGGIIGRVVHRPRPVPEPDRFESHGDLRTTSDVVHSKLREIAGELRTSCESAQGIEARLREIIGSERGDSGRSRLDAVRKEINTVVASLKALEQINGAIDSLSEESKGIAINTALHAGSGMGTQDDLIRLAEEVKEVAARFKDTTRQFAQVATAMRASTAILATIAGDPIGRPGRGVGPEEDLESVLSRVSLWVERGVVLSDKVSNFGQSYDISVSSVPERGLDSGPEGTEVRGSPTVETREPEEFDFESLDRSQSLFGGAQESREQGLETGRTRKKGTFEELSSEATSPFDATDAVEDLSGETREDTEEEPREVQPEPEADRFGSPILNRFSRAPAPVSDDETVLPAEPSRASQDEDRRRFEPDHRGPAEIDTSSETLADLKTSTKREDADTSEPAEDIVDLYALGAVDYDPALHG